MACGDASAHELRIMCSVDALSLYVSQDHGKIMVQNYINHGAVLYKAYVIGDLTRVIVRSSTRDMNPGHGEDGRIDSPWIFFLGMLLMLTGVFVGSHQSQLM